nr:hypothetical protein Itr_chr10CG12360 [Ipomoea trifida]
MAMAEIVKEVADRMKSQRREQRPNYRREQSQRKIAHNSLTASDGVTT